MAKREKWEKLPQFVFIRKELDGDDTYLVAYETAEEVK